MTPREPLTHLEWPNHGASKLVEADGTTHLLDFGGPAGRPLLVCLHGFGGSAVNWGLVGPDLSADFKVLAPDLAAHGTTPAHAHEPTVPGVLRQVEALLEAVYGQDGPTYLVGSSFGGAIALMVAERAAVTVDGVVILDAPTPNRQSWSLDPAMTARRLLVSAPGVPALLRRRTTARTPRQVVEEQLRTAGSDPAAVDAGAVDASVAVQQVRHLDADGYRAQHRLLCSLLRVFERGTRYTEMTKRVQVPVLWLHGEQDPLVPIAQARTFVAIHPRWQLRTNRTAGHVPHLDDPSWVSAAIRNWTATLPVTEPPTSRCGDPS
jgi:pimeloyl-ACP methyl ester carboxylesterase